MTVCETCGQAIAENRQPPEMLIARVAQFMLITPPQIMNMDNRRRKIVLARKIAIVLCHELLGTSQQHLSLIFNCDWATIKYALDWLDRAKAEQNSEYDAYLIARGKFQ